MTKAQWFKFYPQDFILGTLKLSNAEIGAYIKLLCHQWDKGHIPNNNAEIEEITDTKIEKLAKVLKKFETTNESTLINIRLNEEKRKMAEYSEMQSSKGSKGGRPKKSEKPDESQKNPQLSNGLTEKSHTETETEAEVFTLVNTKEADEDEEADASKSSSPIFQNSIQPQPFERIEFIANEFLTSSYYAAAREQLCIAKKITLSQLSQFVVDFNNSLIAKAEYEKQAKDWISHLGYWISKNQQPAAITLTRPAVKSAAEINRERANAANK